MSDHNRRPPFSLPSDLVVVGFEVRLLHLPMLEALDSAHGETAGAVRELAVVAVHGPAGEIGWGECAALESAGYWHETASSSFHLLSRVLTGIGRRSVADLVDLVDPLADQGLDRDRFPMAAAALEMAALDLALKSCDRTLAEWLQVDTPTVAAGATVGLGPTPFVLDRVADLARNGYGRIKVKVEPSSVQSLVEAVTGRLAGQVQPDFQLHIDGNGGFAPIDQSPRPGANPGSISGLVDVARAGVTAIEQPFPRDDNVSGRLLRAALAEAGSTTLVMADESADSIAAADEVVSSGSADGVVVKPSRLGGLGVAHRVIQSATNRGRPVAVGGMVESALGRHSLAPLAALPGVTVTGDLSPARRWLADDPWPDLDTNVIDGQLHVVVPLGPGVAPPPDTDKIERYTVDQVIVGH